MLYKDEGIFKGFSTQADEYKLKIKQFREIRFDGNSITSNVSGFGEEPKSNFSMPEEVIKVNAIFFKKPYYKQRAVLRLVILWAVKHYFKILFKK